MSTTGIAIAAGLLLGVGLWVTVAGLTPVLPRSGPGPARGATTGRALFSGSAAGTFLVRHRRALAISGALGLLAGVTSGWYILLIVLPVASVTLPPLVRTPQASKDVQVLSDLESWVRGLAGILVGGAVGLEQALRASLGSSPDSIRPGLSRLVARLDAQQPIKPALHLWADEMALHAVDMVAATLILESDRREGGISRALDELADAMADQTQARRQIETDRSATRSAARWVTLISLGMIAMIAITTSYMDEYTTPLGQVAALVLAALYGGCLYWMYKISLGKPSPRFLPATVDRSL